MNKGKKTTGQPISELAKLHKRIAELEKGEAEYKLKEQSLRKSKELFEKTFVSQLDALLILDANTPPRILNCNPSATKVFGHSRKEMLGRKTDFLHVDKRRLRKFQEYLHPAIAEQGYFHLSEFEMKRNDGRIFPTEHTVVPLEDDQGKRIGWVSIVRDISERKRAEKALRASEEKYRILIEQAIDGILIIQDGIIKFANRRLAEANGRTVEELLDTNFLNYVHPDEVPRVANRYQRRLAGEDVEQIYETVLLHKDGHEIPVEINAGGITYQGNPAVFAFVRDHTERKGAEEALRNSEEKLRAIIEASPLPLVTIQSEGIVTLWNPAAERLFGWSEDEVLGKYNPIIPEEKQEEHRNLRSRIFQRGEAFTGCEVVRQKKDGTLIDVALSTAPIYDAEGNVESVMGIVEDISQRKRTEEELHKAHKELERRVEERTEEVLKANERLKREIAERKQAEEALRESERRYKLATVAGQVGVWDWDIESSDIYLDPNLKAMLGFEDHEIRNHLDDWGRYVHPDDAELVMSEAEAHLKGLTRQYEVAHRMLHKDGSVRWFLARGTALKDAGGKPYRVLGTDTDITERKRAEEELQRAHQELQTLVEKRTAELVEINEQLKQQIAEHKRAEEELRESEERFRKAFDYAALGMVLVSPGGRFLKVNSYFCQMVGYTEGELLNRTFNDVTHPDDYHISLDVLSQVVDGIEPYAWAEKRYLHKDGRIVWGMLSTAAIRDAVDNVVYLVSHIQDITERKLAEEALRESEERYSSLFKNNHSVMLLINPENAAIVDANPAACSFYGWSHEELTSRKITDVNTLTREQVCREMKRAQSGKAQHFLFRHRLANDEIRDVEVYSGPITIEGKRLLYSIIHDISERRLAEEELEEAHRRLEQRALELSQLNEKFKQEIEERKLVEQKLRMREAELETKANELVEVNVALRVLLKRREEDKTELGERILSNVKELVLPYVERLRKAQLTSQCAAYVNILESNLNEIISPFALKLSSKLLGLTPTEIQIANLIKEGKTTKDIAAMLHLSPRTVEFHRNNIRKKMGIKNKKANLRSHLQSM
jgi:PAS domain S-box-containing protein